MQPGGLDETCMRPNILTSPSPFSRLLAKRHSILWLLLAVTLVRGLIYTAIVPPWQAPDEPYHFLSAHSPHIQRLPDVESNWQQLQTEIIASLVQFRFWDTVVFVPAVSGQDDVYRYLPRGLQATSQPITPRAFTYHLLSPLLRVVEGQGVTFQLYWARVLSVMINMGVVAVAFGIAQLLFRGESFGTLLLPLSIVLLPTHTGMMAAVNEANPAELLISVAIFWMMLAVVRGFRWHLLVLVAVFTALGVAAKPTTFFFVPVLVLLLVIYGWRKIPGWWKLLIVPVGVAFLYGIAQFSHRFESLFRQTLRRATGPQSGVFAANLKTLPFQRSAVELFGRFAADLGWHSLPVSDVWGWAFLVLSALAVIGLIRLAWRDIRAGSGWSRDPLGWATLICILCVVVDVALLAIASAYHGVSYFSARYLMGAIIPIMTLLVIGWRELIPQNWRVEGLALMASFFFLFDAVTVLYRAVPFFYPLWH